METTIIEGTVADIQRQLDALNLQQEKRLRVVVTEADPGSTFDEDLVLNAPRRNGFILIPTRPGGERITAELIDSLSED